MVTSVVFSIFIISMQLRLPIGLIVDTCDIVGLPLLLPAGGCSILLR